MVNALCFHPKAVELSLSEHGVIRRRFQLMLCYALTPAFLPFIWFGTTFSTLLRRMDRRSCA